MKTYRIPNTDLDVTRLAYGTWHIGGTWDQEPPSDEVRARASMMLSKAVELGINHIDLADIYTKGKSDQVVGEWLTANPGMRDKLILQAKCGIVLGDDPNPGDPGRYDFSYDNIVGAVEGTLKRLNTDYVDLLALHRPDPLVEPEEVARALDHLHSSGKVRYFGVSNHTAGQIALLKRYVNQPIVLNQVELNLLHHGLISEGITANMSNLEHTAVSGTLDYCRLNDIMIQAWSPVAGGRLFTANSESPANEQALAAEIHQIASTHGTTPEAIGLGWLLRHPAGIQPIIGTLNPDRLAVSCPADDVTLSRIEWYRLLAASRGAGVP